ncbi:MAG: ribosome maturation factor RimP [Gammaproteobacteria bacterium]
MSGFSQELTELLEPTVTALGYELLGCVLISKGRQLCLRVYIDNSTGISLDDCATVSRQLAAVMDVEDPLRQPYELEVTSPGVDRPLFKKQHYQNVIGQKIQIALRVAQEQQKNFKGRLVNVADSTIKIVTDDHQEIEFSLQNIRRANLIVEW